MWPAEGQALLGPKGQSRGGGPHQRPAADVMQSAVPAMLQLPDPPDAGQLDRGLADLRGLAGQPGAGLGWTIHKSQAVAG